MIKNAITTLLLILAYVASGANDIVLFIQRPNTHGFTWGLYGTNYVAQFGSDSISWDLEITTTNANELFSIWPTTASGLSITWGDGSVSNYTGSDRVDHYYVATGTNTLSITGSVTRLRFGHDTPTRRVLTKSLSRIRSTTGFTSFETTFLSCALLNYMPVDFFGDLTGITTLRQTWSGCSSVTNFPSVSVLTNVTDLFQTWMNCSSATNLPEVSTLTKVSGSLWATWQGCSKVTRFPDVSALTNVNNLGYAWNGCSSATNFPEVSALTNVTSLSMTWLGCSVATNFPNVSTLTNVTTLASTWYNCYAVSNLPSVSTLTKVTSLDSTWWGCTSATNFPDVSTLTNVTTLASTWRGCTKAVSFPDISALTRVTTLNNTYRSGGKPTSFPDVSTLTNVGTLYSAWYECISMTSCPALFPGSTNLTNVAYAFYGCIGIVGAVPELWDTNVWANTNFLLTAANHTNCFKNCTGAANYGDIPAGWK